MYTIYIYNDTSRRLERYKLEAYHIMPYSCHNSMYVSDFFCNTISTVGWTSSEFLFTWSKLSKGELHPLSVFRRIFEGGAISESMHYAGIAADINSNTQQNVFPFRDKNHVALHSAGFPPIKFGDVGLFVLVLQDALCALGFDECELDGFWGYNTSVAFSHFCEKHGFPQKSECDRYIWSALAFHAAGCGINKSTKYINRQKIIF